MDCHEIRKKFGRIGIRYRTGRTLNERQLRRQYQIRIEVQESGQWLVRAMIPANSRGDRKQVWKLKCRVIDGPRIARQAAERYRVPEQGVVFVEYEPPIEEEEEEEEDEIDEDEEESDDGRFEEDEYREEVLGSDVEGDSTGDASGPDSTIC